MRLYDTSTRTVRDFVPLVEGQVSIYLCGATVQAPPHIGHIRSGLNFDVLRRWFAHRGADVVFCRNVTDIDDKIIAKSYEQDIPPWRLAQANERAFDDAYTALGCLPSTVEPRATGHIPEMIAMMDRLIATGHAYPSGGDVYFDVSSFPEYGALSGQKPDSMREAEDAGGGCSGKRDRRDFALWKSAKPGEPSWETPWGHGRPGWHLECSAMAHKYLGREFDIHGGGLDLVFPHHENEIAQSKAAGDPFARYWMHNAWVTLAGEKMSKSLGNSVLVSEMLKRWSPLVLRYYLATPHYRSMIEYSVAALREAEVSFGRIEGFLERAGERTGAVVPAADVPEVFAAAMDDDLGVPQAMAVVHNTVRDGNTALAAGDKDAVVRHAADVRAMLGVLGMDPLAEQWTAGASASRSGELHDVVDHLVKFALEQRQAARARKDYAAADAVRESLGAAGIVVEDTPDGPRWTLHRD